MPVLETGKRVDLIFNTLGVYNRLNIFQLFEQSITFITNRIVEKMVTLYSIKEKEELLFGIINIFNEKQAEQFKTVYKSTCKTKKDKEEYFDIVEKEGIYIHILPLWHTKNIYDCVREAYDTYPWIQQYDVYIWEPKSERYVKMMFKQIVGEMYIMKLKQNSKKGLSARSTGSINKRGVPEKSDNAKKHTDPYSKNPTRFGRQETINQFISVDPNTVARQHMLYRSSVKGRRALSSMLLKSDKACGGSREIKLTPDLTNRNVEILNAYLRIMGLELVFDRDVVDLTPDKSLKNHIYKGNIYLCDEEEMKEYMARDIAHAKINEGEIIYIGDDTDYNTLVDSTTQLIKSDIHKYIE